MRNSMTAAVAPLLFAIIIGLGWLGYSIAFGTTDQQATYLESIKEDTIAVYDNAVTDKKSDFFVVTSTDEAYLVDVAYGHGEYSHTEAEVTEDTKELLSMKELAIQAKANEATQDKGSTDALWKALVLFNFMKK